MMKPCVESDEEEEIVRICNRGTEEQQLDNLPLRGKDIKQATYSAQNVTQFCNCLKLSVMCMYIVWNCEWYISEKAVSKN